MIPLAIPNLSGNEGRYLQECVATNYVSSVGPYVTRFEEMVALATGTRRAVATSSGTTGLHAALTAVGVRHDDLVVLPSFTFIASANAITHCGASPWLFDIDAESWTLDSRLLAAALERDTSRRTGDLVHTATGRRIAAIMPVYTNGTPADMDPLVELARAYRLPIVADAAAAVGARYKRRPIGALGADLTVLSFNGNKTLTAGGGGAAVGDETLTDQLRHLTTTARRGPDYDHDMVGFNYRMTNIQAAVGCAQLERLEEFVTRKRWIAQEYRRALGDLPGLGFFPSPTWAESACWLSAITVPDSASARGLIEELRSRDIDARAFWKPVHLQAPYRTAPAYGALRVTEDVWARVVTLPCSSGLTREEQTHVIESVRQTIGVGVRRNP